MTSDNLSQEDLWISRSLSESWHTRGPSRAYARQAAPCRWRRPTWLRPEPRPGSAARPAHGDLLPGRATDSRHTRDRGLFAGRRQTGAVPRVVCRAGLEQTGSIEGGRRPFTRLSEEMDRSVRKIAGKIGDKTRRSAGQRLAVGQVC